MTTPNRVALDWRRRTCPATMVCLAFAHSCGPSAALWRTEIWTTCMRCCPRARRLSTHPRSAPPERPFVGGISRLRSLRWRASNVARRAAAAPRTTALPAPFVPARPQLPRAPRSPHKAPACTHGRVRHAPPHPAAPGPARTPRRPLPPSPVPPAHRPFPPVRRRLTVRQTFLEQCDCPVRIPPHQPEPAQRQQRPGDFERLSRLPCQEQTPLAERACPLQIAQFQRQARELAERNGHAALVPEVGLDREALLLVRPCLAIVPPLEGRRARPSSAQLPQPVPHLPVLRQALTKVPLRTSQGVSGPGTPA